MQSGRIMPVIRQFFSASTQQAKPSLDSNSGNGNQGGHPEREPTREEALAAMEVLSQQEEFHRQGLIAQLEIIENRFCINVVDGRGNKLRQIRGAEILRVLSTNTPGLSRTLGHILDRRV